MIFDVNDIQVKVGAESEYVYNHKENKNPEVSVALVSVLFNVSNNSWCNDQTDVLNSCANSEGSAYGMWLNSIWNRAPNSSAVN